jgi:ABC-type lipoprotein release transport system permease subunit
MIILNGLKLSSAGIAVGLLLASALASALPENMVAPADPQDPMVYGTVVVVLLTVALLSCYYPALRASRVDPNECLRSE